MCNVEEGQYQCKRANNDVLDALKVPSNSCHIKNCQNCVIGLKTFIIDEQLELLEPESLIFLPTNETSNTSTFFRCHLPTGKNCECNQQQLCIGSQSFCAFYPCSENASCSCTLTHQKPKYRYITDQQIIENPPQITLSICLVEKPSRRKPFKLHRRLLEEEEAVFIHNNLTVKFKDPILYLPGSGRVILRTEDYEHILTVPDDNLIVLPFEMLAFKTTLLIIYISPNGYTVTGTVHVTGKSVCQKRPCYLCWNFLSTFHCVSTYIRYAIYLLMIVGFLILVFLLKSIFKLIILSLHSIAIFFLLCCKIFKFMARISLLTGALIGSILRDTFNRTQGFLENHAAPHLYANRYQLVVVALFLHLSTVNADCSTHAIIQSDLKACELVSDGTKVCKIFTTAEFTLPSLNTATCLWFTDKKDNHVFSLNIKLDDITCHFQTKREYYTFPITAKHLSQISCIFNAHCGRGVHCRKSKIGKDGLGFEAETPESLAFPGLSSCHAGGLGVGCTILTRAACAFYRTWYVPNLLETYEVSKVIGHKCQYHISLKHVENGTVSKLTLRDVAYTKSGIKISILGAYEQPQLHISDYYIKRVGRPSETYLAPACSRNHPKTGQIGQVQSNVSYTDDFIFDPNISKCDFFEVLILLLCILLQHHSSLQLNK